MRMACYILPFFLCFVPQQGKTSTLRYHQCTQRIKTDAKAAFEEATSWLVEEEHAAARHCKALALIALNRPADAAVELDTIAHSLSAHPSVAATMYEQAAAAWQLAERPDNATRCMQEAADARNQQDDGLDRQLFTLKRAAKQLADLDKIYTALQLADEGLLLVPSDVELLALRAILLAKMEDCENAQKDLAAARQLDPLSDFPILFDRCHQP